MATKVSRGWCYTINNYTEDDEHFAFELSLDSTYTVCGKEIGEGLTPHLQGFVYYKHTKTLGGMKLRHPTAHWEAIRGTPRQAADYCKKDGNYFEEGIEPMTQTEKGDAGKAAIAERWQLAKEGRFEELPPEQIKTYEYIYRKNLKVEDRSELQNLWIHGPSGCGKSQYVRKTYSTFYSKPMSKWWDGYNGEEVVVLDDFDPSHGKYLGYFLKIWADHYSFNAEVKGGMIHIRPKVIIVTSQYSINECFEESQTVEAINRRFQTTDLGFWNGEVRSHSH